MTVWTIPFLIPPSPGRLSPDVFRGLCNALRERGIPEVHGRNITWSEGLAFAREHPEDSRRQFGRGTRRLFLHGSGEPLLEAGRHLAQTRLHLHERALDLQEKVLARAAAHDQGWDTAYRINVIGPIGHPIVAALWRMVWSRAEGLGWQKHACYYEDGLLSSVLMHEGEPYPIYSTTLWAEDREVLQPYLDAIADAEDWVKELLEEPGDPVERCTAENNETLVLRPVLLGECWQRRDRLRYSGSILQVLKESTWAPKRRR